MTDPDLVSVGAIIAEVAAAEALPRWRNLGHGDIVEKNGPDDVVTVADRAVEAVLAQRLCAFLAGSRVVGEEAVHADPAVLSALTGPGDVWVIDPIDGTSAFARGEPAFAVMVALMRDGAPFAGWIHAPVSGETTWAVRGTGVWQQTSAGRRQLPRPAAPASLAAMHGVTGAKLMSPQRLARFTASRHRFAGIEPAICAGMEYPRLATGDVAFALYSKSEPWDHLPGLAILAEHGVHAARHDGAPYRPDDNRGGLLIAPDRESWHAIHAVLLA